MERNVNSQTAFVFINSDRFKGNVFYFFEGLEESQPVTGLKYLNKLVYGNGRVYQSSRDLRFKSDGYSVERNVHQVIDTFKQKVVTERTSGNILDMIFANGQLYDIGHEGLFRTFDNIKIAGNRGGIPIGLAYRNGRLYHTVQNPNSKYGGIVLDSFDDRVIFEKEGHINQLVFGDGRLFGAGEFRIPPGGAFDHEFRIYDVISGELIAKREKAIKSIAYYGGRLYDSTYYGCIFDTFTQEIVVQRKPLVRGKITSKKTIQVLAEDEDSGFGLAEIRTASAAIYQTVLRTDGEKLYDMTTSGISPGIFGPYENPVGVIYDTLSDKPICSTLHWWAPSPAEMERLRSSDPERVEQYDRNQEWFKRKQGWIEDLVFVPVTTLENLLKKSKR